MQTLLRQLLVAILGGVVAAGVFLGVNYMNRGPDIALAQTSAAVATIDGADSTDADAPKVINYQGQVFNPNTNQPRLNETMNFSFRIYNNSAGTSQIYQEDALVQTNSEGFFATQIGTQNRFGGDTLYNIFNGQELYLGVFINNEQLAPIQPVTFVPYAFWSVHAHHLDNYDADDFLKIAAYGAINPDGSRRSGDNFSSGYQNVGGQQVLIVRIDDVVPGNVVDNYTTIVTPACENPNIPVMTGIGSSPRPGDSSHQDLIIDIWNEDGNRVQCRVSFMVIQR